MATLSWPMAFILAVLVVCASVLGAMHVLDPTWLERTFSALLGFAVGMGVRANPKSGSSAPPSTPVMAAESKAAAPS